MPSPAVDGDHLPYNPLFSFVHYHSEWNRKNNEILAHCQTDCSKSFRVQVDYLASPSSTR